jgi:predicted Fe-Mo cluster-binding NifX family protein
MKIAIASNENKLESVISQHFGRSEWYYIFDAETRKGEFVENPSGFEQDKAGCNAVNFLAERGIAMAIAGRFGSKVVEAFRVKNVQMIVPEYQLTINEIINQLK